MNGSLGQSLIPRQPQNNEHYQRYTALAVADRNMPDSGRPGEYAYQDSLPVVL